MAKFFKSLKTKAMNIGLKFLSIDEKLAYIAFKTKSNHVRPIVILPTGKTSLKKLLDKMEDNKRFGDLYNGTLNGIPVSIIVAGIGNSHAAIIMEALKRSPCKVAIRVDYCGGLETTDPNLKIADVVIPQEVFITDGTAHSYLQKYASLLKDLPLNYYPVEKGGDKMLYPSYQDNYLGIQGDSTLLQILQDSLRLNNYDFSIINGKLWSVDALFCETDRAIQTWTSYGAISVDMESSAVYLLGNIFKIPTISILGISDVPDSGEWNLQKTKKLHPNFELILDNAISVLWDALPKIHKEFVSK